MKTNGGRIPGEVMPFYNAWLGGASELNPIFWGVSEPNIARLIATTLAANQMPTPTTETASYMLMHVLGRQ